jgi:hypothetical protein
VTQQEAQKLAARIPGGTDDSYLHLINLAGFAAEMRSRLEVSLVTAEPLVARLLT